MIDVVYAKGTFPVQTDLGGRVMVRMGSHWAADDPVVRAHPEQFSEDPRYGLAFSREPVGWNDPPVETATAAPGERRNIRRVQRDS